jgi:hypothetical protein
VGSDSQYLSNEIVCPVYWSGPRLVLCAFLQLIIMVRTQEVVRWGAPVSKSSDNHGNSSVMYGGDRRSSPVSGLFPVLRVSRRVMFYVEGSATRPNSNLEDPWRKGFPDIHVGIG